MAAIGLFEAHLRREFTEEGLNKFIGPREDPGVELDDGDCRLDLQALTA
ncbi:MAG: hypothetical protein M3R66_05965 [Actinomycetota bacterium]|nr:hypothetical protein [Actinomycetota bacterium]